MASSTASARGPRLATTPPSRKRPSSTSDNEPFDAHAHYVCAGVEAAGRWSQAVAVTASHEPSSFV
eukprot:20032-Alexandrium_andersonii.AAC.1